ncbi:MAG: hypothetical protein H6Q41_232 [Deltaproteobacteria bacterium]|jgi:hypothetical protein|nr:hypothetical protein [Deltaproteobacteria bacterium]
MNQLIRCRNCDQIFFKSPFDRYPEYDFGPNQPPENFQCIEKDDFQDFLIHHRGHQLELLKIIEDSYVSEKAYSEPIKTSFFKATNGREKFVIKKFRERIDEPLKYQLIPGDYSLKCVHVEIQSEEISRQLEREVKPPLPGDKIDAFLKVMSAIAEDIDVSDLETIPEETHHPLEVYYKIDDVHIMHLLRRCRNIFKGRENVAMEEFIHRHKDDGVLLLKATYKIELTEIARPKKTIPAFLHLEKEKVVGQK